jgi:MerR family transcriptional regulator, thiopeptide resistance regulator
MQRQVLKVGELSKQTGLSIRTLHYYDEIGLLRPSLHTESGHRLYTGDDVARLQQIVCLRHLGLSLEEVRDCLSDPDLALPQVIQLSLQRMREQITTQQRIVQRLEAMARRLEKAEEVSVEELTRTIEGMTMIEKYYTPEQLEKIAERGRVVGEERIKEVEAEWPRLMAEVQAEMDAGTDPASERVQELARRWMALVQEFTGGDPGITESLKKMWQQEPQIHGMDTGPVRAMGEYINKALAASKQS